MIRPDFRDYKNSGNELMHSAKGTTWGKHKYVAKKIINGKTRYIYRFADDLRSGRYITTMRTKFAAKTVVDTAKEEQAKKNLEQARKDYDRISKQYNAIISLREQNRRSTDPSKYAFIATNFAKMKAEYQKAANNLIKAEEEYKKYKHK